jgi:hypothetical protein
MDQQNIERERETQIEQERVGEKGSQSQTSKNF